MDLGDFADEVLHVVEGVCGDAVVETHEQATLVLATLMRKPGRDRVEVCAALGVDPRQDFVIALSREGVYELTENDEAFASLCRADAVYTRNMLIQRVNQAATWREEYRDLASGSTTEEPASDDDCDDGFSVEGSLHKDGAREGCRARALKLFAKHLEAAPQGLSLQLARRLEDEVHEQHPDEKDYRCHARSIASNLRRNEKLAANYASGRVPPQWVAQCGFEALAPRTQQMQRRAFKSEALWESKMDDEAAAMKSHANEVGKATNLAPPPSFEDIFST